jgi:hypothetical protein
MNKILIFILLFLISKNLLAADELVCKGRQAEVNNRAIYVNCSDRKEFVQSLGAAWHALRKNFIGGTLEDLCWKAYNEAKDTHPSISLIIFLKAF